MAKIPCLQGWMDTSELGVTLAHEHIFVHDPGVLEAYPHLWDPKTAVAAARRKIMAAYDVGVRSMIDMAVLGNGRNVPFLLRHLADLPMHILVATGAFYKMELPGFFQTQSPDVLADCFIHDVEHGIDGTYVRPCIIKTCTDRPGVTVGVEKELRAVARAHLATNLPIHTHSEAGNRSALDQLRIFREEGVDLTRVYIGHVINTDDFDYLHAILETGCFVGFDRWAAGPLPPIPGLNAPPPVTRERATEVLAQLCREGFAPQILIGNDGCSYQTVVRFANVEESPGLEPDVIDYILFHNEIAPKLLRQGVTPEELEQMLVVNPRSLFERCRDWS